MRIYNATKSTMNLPMPNGSRLIIKSMECSKQFFPTVELLNLLVSAYTRDDIAIIIDGGPSEMSMGAVVSSLPALVADSLEDAIMRFKKEEKAEPAKKVEAPKPEVKSAKVAPTKTEEENK